MKYYTLLTRPGTAYPWEIAFGDYDREVVQGEADDCRDGGLKVKIMVTGDSQAAINAAFQRINA